MYHPSQGLLHFKEELKIENNTENKRQLDGTKTRDYKEADHKSQMFLINYKLFTELEFR